MHEFMQKRASGTLMYVQILMYVKIFDLKSLKVS